MPTCLENHGLIIWSKTLEGDVDMIAGDLPTIEQPFFFLNPRAIQSLWLNTDRRDSLADVVELALNYRRMTGLFQWQCLQPEESS